MTDKTGATPVTHPPAVIGLDLSMTCVGICLPDGTTEHVRSNTSGTLHDRATHLRDELRPWLAPGADLFVVEAIGTRFVQTAISMAYLHCMIDDVLNCERVVKVPPASLKRFATGRGNADKHMMTIAAIRSGWTSDEGSTHDEADAWWLWALGRHVLAAPVVGDTAYRRAEIDKLRAAS